MKNNLQVSRKVETRWLDASALDEVMDLQTTVCEELKRVGQSQFFVPLTRDSRQNLFNEGHAVAGLYLNNRLVAHMVFFDLSKRDLLKQRYHSRQLIQPDVCSGDYYIISEMVAPDCRRNGYLSQLADWAMAELYFESRQVNPNLWATVSSINMNGLHCNLRLGLRIQEEGFNLIDGTSVYLLKGELLPKLSINDHVYLQTTTQAA